MQSFMLPNLSLGDKRLDNRCNQLINQFVKKPTMSIPQSCGDWKSTKAAYRFFTNDTVSAEKIMQAQYQGTQQRIKETNEVILVAQDTTDCDYTTHPQTKGLGYLQGEKLFGIKMHSALAITESGVPLGLLAQKRWIRPIAEFGKRRRPGREKLGIQEKESYRWIETIKEVAKRIADNKDIIIIGDREVHSTSEKEQLCTSGYNYYLSNESCLICSNFSP